MTHQIQELEILLTALIGEHERLLKLIEAQQSAMKVLDVQKMQLAQQQQEQCRMHIAALETRRKQVVTALASEPVTLTRLAQLYPPHSTRLLHLRDQLKDLVVRITQRTHVVSRLASAVLGHLNVAARLLSGAIEQAGVYTRSGLPKSAGRIGMMEAVG